MTGRGKVLSLLISGGAVCLCVSVPAVAAEEHPWTRPGCTAGPRLTMAVERKAEATWGSGGSAEVARVSAGLAADGSAYVRAVLDDFDLMKTVSRSGEIAIRLQRGGDVVQVTVEEEGVVVSRNGQSRRLALDAAGEDDFLAVKALLAGSRSVRAMRQVGAGIAAAAERTPAGMALLLSDAVVGLVDGDVAAVHRLAERIGRRRQTVRLVSDKPGCYEKWEAEVIRAWDDYLECLATYPSLAIWRDACGLRWILWAESAWFSFLKCVGSPFINT